MSLLMITNHMGMIQTGELGGLGGEVQVAEPEGAARDGREASKPSRDSSPPCQPGLYHFNDGVI